MHNARTRPGVDESPGDFDDDDYRKHGPRFEGENFAKNLELAGKVRELASGKGRTSAQPALARVLAQGRHIADSGNQAREVP